MSDLLFLSLYYTVQIDDMLIPTLIILPVLCRVTVLQPSDPNYAGQGIVYSDIGKEMLHHAFEG